MTDYSSLAINDLRLYLWENIKLSNLLDENDYYADGFDTALIPIIPAQQVPEFNNLLPGKTYITYEYEILPIEEKWWMVDEIATFMVHSPDYEKSNSIMNLMMDIFKRYDDSAKDVRQLDILSNNFIFHYTAINSINSPSPSKREGGIKVGYVTVLYCYSRKNNEQGRFL